MWRGTCFKGALSDMVSYVERQGVRGITATLGKEALKKPPVQPQKDGRTVGDKRPKISGSERRQRTKTLQIRLTESEFEAIAEKAESALLTAPSYARHMLLDTPAPRARRRPSIEAETLARILAQLGKVGSNLNQLAKQANTGHRIPPDEISAALSTVADLRAATLSAMGRQP